MVEEIEGTEEERKTSKRTSLGAGAGLTSKLHVSIDRRAIQADPHRL